MVMHLPNVKYRMLFKEKYISKNYPDFYNQIMNMYKDSQNYNEKLYRYIHNINKIPLCPVCGGYIPYRNSPAGYGKYCSQKCMVLSEERKESIKSTKIKKYGDPGYNNSKKARNTLIEKYGSIESASKKIYEKVKQTCLKRYGADNVFKLKKIQDKCCDSKMKKYGDPYYSNREKNKQTCIERYGVDNPMKNKDIISKFNNTMLSKYGVKWAMNSEQLLKKLSKSLIKAHIEGKYDMSGKKKKPSKIELDFQNYLIQNNINFEFQYRSEKYPYLCDFYIPDYDLYIEIQGNWTHGRHQYTGDNDDLNILNEWKNKNSPFYDNAIYVWTILDVKKRDIAKNNNLNYLEIYSIKINECISIFEEYINRMTHDRKKEK